ncbi:MAG: DUF2505 domain-containing protein [Propionibacteriaceae bacterium]|nr:DUF2505 domain-containing protein [Propionibacteriaceae bacterium]
MKITSQMAFDAPPPAVADMLVNPDFAQHVGQEINADQVTTTAIADGLSATFTLESPVAARRFLGSHMVITETVTWGKPVGQTYTGQINLSVAGVPASAQGPTKLSPTPTGSQLDYSADFHVKIPIIGKQIEKLAAEYLTDIISACEAVGNQWLRENS